ncbi:MAG: hypothetical protein JXQ29_00335 [Planctomycetes bacterium]|nr:hypothetical protein [Planctomycetota bacterium]
MRVLEIEVHRLSLPVRGAADPARRTLLVARSDLGLRGLGEVPGLLDEETCRAAAAAVAGADPLEWELLRSRLARLPPAVVAAVETACLDLRGKATGRAIHDLLGGRIRASVPPPAGPAGPDPIPAGADPLVAALTVAAGRPQEPAWLDFWALGGFAACRVAAEVLCRQGVAVGLAGGLETGVGLAARLHLAASHPAFSAGLATDHAALARDVLRFGLVVDPAGGYRVPAGPGLGVDLDREALHALGGGGRA